MAGFTEASTHAQSAAVPSARLVGTPDDAARSAGSVVRSNPATREAATSAPSGLWIAVLFVVAAQALWIGAAALTNTALFPDVAEQFIWAQSLEWGYYKHPPLATWLFAAALGLLGSAPWVAGALSGTCLAATGLLTWAIARRIVGPRLAWFCLLLWSLQQPFSVRAYLYNHNVPLVLAIALCAWATVAAWQEPQRARLWLLAGLAAGMATLVKYQAVLPLLGLAWALWRSGSLAQRDVRSGLARAIGVAVLVCMPHVAWLVSHHAPSFAYAASHMESLDAASRSENLLRFIVMQMRTLLPAALCALLWWAASRQLDGNAPRLGRAAGEHGAGMSVQGQRAWIEGLVGVPVVLVIAACALGGVHLQGQWGMQSLQFASIALVAALARQGAVWPAGRSAALAAAVHLIGAGVVVCLAVGQARSTEVNDHALQYTQAQVISDAIAADWAEITDCPLRYVVGEPHVAGLVSAYSGEHPAVLESGDARKSPWIDLGKMRAAGSVHIAARADLLPPEAIHRPDMTLPAIVWRRPEAMVWGIVAPDTECVWAMARAD